MVDGMTMKNATKDAATGKPSQRNSRKTREGVVVSNSMDKTAIIATTNRTRHRRYAKTVQKTTRLVVHDEKNELGIGDRVRIAETRPLSKTKRWRIVRILERAR